jgi:hypothetical protein
VEEPVLLPRRLANYKEIEDYVIGFILGGFFKNWDEICIISESTVADKRHPSRE